MYNSRREELILELNVTVVQMTPKQAVIKGEGQREPQTKFPFTTTGSF